MNLKIFIISLLWSRGFETCSGQQNRTLQMIANRVECDGDTTLTVNISCSMEKVTTSNGGAKVQFTGTFIVDVHKIWMRHQNYIGIGKNRFKLGFIGATLDMCNLQNAIRGTFLNRFVEEALKNTESVIHSCPYRKFEVVQMKNIVFGGSIYLKILRPANYRFDYRLYDEQNRTVAEMRYYAAVGYKK